MWSIFQLADCLESEPGAYVLQALGHLIGRAVKLLGDLLLPGHVHAGELLAQVAVDDRLDRVVVGPEAGVIAAAQGGVLGAHVHLEVLEEVVVLVGAERHEHADGAGEGCVDDGVVAARDQRGLLQTGHGLAQVEGAEQVDFLGGAVEQASVP